jgi:hypothetical protein
MANSQADMCDPGWNELMLAYGTQERFLHEIVHAIDVAAE